MEIRHVDPSNSLAWRDLVVNNKEQIDIRGNLYVDGSINVGEVIVTNNIESSKDNDSTSYFGKAAVGYMGHNNWAGFAHHDKASANNYALMQSSTGETLINSSSGQGIDFRVNNQSKMTLTSNGRVGIGTTNPLAPIDVPDEVGGWVDVNDSYDGKYLIYSGVQSINNFHNPVSASINADGGNVVARGFWAGHTMTFMSDRRIKKDIREIDDSEALLKFRLLKPSKYKYIEPILSGRTSGEIYGFIAQEVAEVLPHAVTIGSTNGTNQGHIPNIMSLCTVTKDSVDTDTYNAMSIEQRAEYISDSEKFTRLTVSINYSVDPTTFAENRYLQSDTTKSTSNFEKNADGEYDPLIFYNIHKKTRQVKILSVINETTFIIDDLLFDESEMISGNQLLLYGQKPDDFHRLNKDAIFTLSTAALQEVDRQQQADKVRIAALETQLTSVLSRLDALENA